MRSLFTRQSGGRSLALIGAGVLLIELAQYWVNGHPLRAWPVVIASLFLAIGFYVLDPANARDGITVITDSAAKIIIAIRSGRRASIEVKRPPSEGGGT